MIRRTMAAVLMVTFAGFASARAGDENTADLGDDRLETARRFVEQSDRYLHHSRLQRGMKGYGLTVLAGTEVVRFEAEIVSVVSHWGPKRDVILARLSGQNLEETGIISGMSGSPIYVQDPADGKDKLIGAVAYGWFGQKEPLCGIQPITQMLAIGGILADEPRPAEAAGGCAGLPAGPVEDFLSAVLDPAKKDLAFLGGECTRPARPMGLQSAGQLLPLKTPVMVSGLSDQAMALAARYLEPGGMICIPAGGLGGALAETEPSAAAEEIRPGSAVGVLLLTGDMEFFAIGTATELIGQKVLAFGHAFFSEGDVAMPMAPAYVHTVVAGLLFSFKLSAPLEPVGALRRDEMVGIGGVLGEEVPMIPVTVRVDWPDDGRSQDFRLGMVTHPRLAPLLTATVVRAAAWAYRDLPQYHTVRHDIEVDFGELGRYRASNISSGADVFEASSDAGLPVFALLNNPLGPPPEIRGIDIRLEICSGERSAQIESLRLDGNIYKPGQTLTGTMTIRPFRQQRQSVPIRFALPEDLPDGDYTLTVCDAVQSVQLLEQEKPQLFDPKTPADLLEALQRIVEPSAERLYIRLPVKQAQPALGREELTDLPPSRAQIIEQANEPDTHWFAESIVRSVASDYVLRGAAEAGFTVRETPGETLLGQ